MDNNPRCYIVGAGENYGLNFTPEEDDYVIAADAGYKYLLEAGITPDMVVGDFDTLKYVPDHPNIVQLKPEKDITDTWEAVTKGFEKGYKEFHLYACMGGRVEHSIANFQLLSHIAEEGGRGYLYDDRSILTKFFCNAVNIELISADYSCETSFFNKGTDEASKLIVVFLV